MKKNLLIACSIIASLCSINIEAQPLNNDTDVDQYISKRNVDVYLEANFTGTPYQNKAFQNGTILKNDLVIAQNIGLRYNAAKDLFEVKKTAVLKDDQAKVLIGSKGISINLENEIGSIEVGKQADFVILNQNPIRVEPQTIKDIKVYATVFSGKISIPISH